MKARLPASGCLRLWLPLFLLLTITNLLHAEQFGIYTYTVTPQNTITITKASNPTGAITVPETIDDKQVTSIGDSAFYNCTALTSLTLPASLTSIADYAFLGCTGLTNFTLPSSLISIEDSAFFNCISLTNLTLPDSLTSIGDSAFHNCTGLISLTLPDSLSSIGGYAFLNCTALTSLTLPASLSFVGYNAFSFCSSLTALYAPLENQAYSTLNGTLFNKNQTTLIAIPAGIAGAYTIPSTVTSIEDTVFHGCTGLTAFYTSPENQNYSTLDGVLFNKNQTRLIAFPPGMRGAYAVPPTAISIGTWAFLGCTGLTSIICPPSLTSIETSAFSNCTALTSLTLPDSLSYVGEGAFYYCTGLTSIALPASLSSIGYSAFSGCTNLTNLTLPTSLVHIGDSAFSGCTSLDDIIFPPFLTSIGASAFSGCRYLTTLNFPPSLTSIRQSAFYSCTGIISITLPASLTLIEPFAFSNCSGLTRLTFLGNAPPGFNLIGPVAPSYATYWLSSRTGFTAPTWLSRPAVRIDEAAYPAASWLLQKNLPYDTDLQQDPDGDGVSHLMAYALNLDPRLNLSTSQPAPVLSPDSLSLTFHAAAAGITYQAETSTGLEGWTTEGVTLSPIGPDQRRTASVPRTGPKRFLRLKVLD